MTGEIQRTGNRILIKGIVNPYHMRRVCAKLYDAVEKRGFQDIFLDFSVCDKITESVMLPILPLISDYRKKGIGFECVFPRDKHLERLFFNTNWAYHINPHKYPQTSYTGDHVPALRFGDGDTDSEEANGILGRIMNMILGQLEVERSVLKAVEWSLWEIMDNVSNHAASPVGGFVQATAFKRTNLVEFVVADTGCGIPQSIGIDDHKEAIRMAIDEGVTRDKEKNAGNGLYGSYRAASLSGGIFEIHSLNGFFQHRHHPEEDLVIQKEPVPYSGTSVRCGIGLSDSKLLDKALRFKGEPYDPPYDHIEHYFEDNAGHLIFNIKEKAQRDLGSRQGGRRIRGMIENLLRERRPIILDFDGISVISSSFADEVFGRLFVDMGPHAFMRQITMRNVDLTVGGLIDRAIMQRTKLGNGVP